jgi:hypothetical protein
LILYSRVCGEQATGEVEIAAKGAPVPDRPGNVDVPGHPIRTSARWTSNDAVAVEIPGTGAAPKPLKVDGVTVTFSRLKEDVWDVYFCPCGRLSSSRSLPSWLSRRRSRR